MDRDERPSPSQIHLVARVGPPPYKIAWLDDLSALAEGFLARLFLEPIILQCVLCVKEVLVTLQKRNGGVGGQLGRLGVWFG